MTVKIRDIRVGDTFECPLNGDVWVGRIERRGFRRRIIGWNSFGTRVDFEYMPSWEVELIEVLDLEDCDTP